jgi:hypothetical protein
VVRVEPQRANRVADGASLGGVEGCLVARVDILCPQEVPQRCPEIVNLLLE